MPKSSQLGQIKNSLAKTLSLRSIFCNAKNITLVQHIVRFIVQKNYAISNAIYSLALNLLKAKNILHKAHIQAVLDSHKNFARDFQSGFECYADLLDIALPCDEVDLLGLIYQCLLLEGEKNIAGAYYTPRPITDEMTKSLDFSNGEIFLDPACGSGAFVLSLKNAKPHQIFGIDNNPLAVFIAKVNMLLKFSDVDFLPQIYCADFLDYEENLSKSTNDILSKEFDYIYTNPPWGIYRKNAYRGGKKARPKHTKNLCKILSLQVSDFRYFL